jgi:hypothetical protein
MDQSLQILMKKTQTESETTFRNLVKNMTNLAGINVLIAKVSF